MRAAVLSHMGVAALPRYVARDDLVRGAVDSQLEDHPLTSQEIHAVYPSPHYLPARARVFVEFLREAFADPRHDFAAGQSDTREGI